MSERSYLLHGRRHAPGGSDPIPNLGDTVMPYATVSLPSWSWPTGDTFVDFTGATVTISDPSVYTNNLGTDIATPILIQQTGIYLIWGMIGTWNSAWGTAARFTSFGPDFVGIGPSASSFPLTYADLGGPNLYLSMQGIGTFPSVPTGGAVVAMEVDQNSGANRSVSAYIHVLRLTTNGDGI